MHVFASNVAAVLGRKEDWQRHGARHGAGGVTYIDQSVGDAGARQMLNPDP